MNPYSEVFAVFHDWYKKGLINLKAPVDSDDYCSADLQVLEFLGYSTGLENYDKYNNNSAIYRAVANFSNSEVFPEWLLEPHAYVLFRIKLASMDVSLQEKFGVTYKVNDNAPTGS